METYVHICGGFRRLADWMFILILSISVMCWLLMLTLILLSLEQTCLQSFKHITFSMQLCIFCLLSLHSGFLHLHQSWVIHRINFHCFFKDWLFSYIHLPVGAAGSLPHTHCCVVGSCCCFSWHFSFAYLFYSRVIENCLQKNL